MAWKIFEQEAARYERWYATPRGQRVDRAECALLAWLLAWFPRSRSALEIGCGTAHFTRWLASRGLLAIGLDRSPAMLREARHRIGGSAFTLADAHRLPLRDRAVDLAVLVTTLEFLELPQLALREAVRVAEQGLVLVVLNRWSPGAVSRRSGPGSRGAILRRARDLSWPRLRDHVEEAAGTRFEGLHWRSALLPRPFDRFVTTLPFGDVLGVAVELASRRRPIASARPAPDVDSASGTNLRESLLERLWLEG